MHQPLDPRRVNVCVDNNALQPPDGQTDDVDRFLRLWNDGTIQVVVPHGVRSEALHPNTPAWVREAMAGGIYTLPTSLTATEVKQRRLIEDVLRGNAAPGRHAADASHVADACKHGGYFVTHDERVLERAHTSGDALPPSLQIVTLARFMEIYDAAVAQRPERRRR